jgi:hypothetical protein
MVMSCLPLNTRKNDSFWPKSYLGVLSLDQFLTGELQKATMGPLQHIVSKKGGDEPIDWYMFKFGRSQEIDR